MNINDLTIGEAKELAAMFGGSVNAKAEPINKGRYIVIGNRGNVVVGDLVLTGDIGVLSNSSVIRRWGTDNGLGQLALEGKKENTKLDPCGEFEFNMLTTCGMIKVTSDL